MIERPKAETGAISGSSEVESNVLVDAFKKHYAATFAAYGATSQGVDWGASEKVAVRYAKMLEVIEAEQVKGRRISLLDVGCGYGGLLAYAKERNVALDYVGIDVVPEMIASARKAHPEAQFHVGDILATNFGRTFDYAVCNGILTLKLQASLRDADVFAQSLLRKMFASVRRGIAFNTMSTYVDFMGPNGYHKSPLEMIAFCASALSTCFRLDHAYAPFEYTVFVYHRD
jgi:SAM-dependent methyltransferase